MDEAHGTHSGTPLQTGCVGVSAGLYAGGGGGCVPLRLQLGVRIPQSGRPVEVLLLGTPTPCSLTP